MNPSASELQAQAQANALSQTQYYMGQEHAQEKKIAHVRERRNSTITGLTDSELLMMRSASKTETIPQVRQRLLGELIGCAPVATEHEGIDGGAGGQKSEDAARRLSSNDGERERRLQWPSKRLDSGESDGNGRPGGSRDVTPKPKPRIQHRLEFGDQVVVDIVEREDGWVADPRGKGKGSIISGSIGGSMSASGSVSGEGSLRGID